MLDQYRVSKLFDLTETMATETLAGVTYPWEALPLTQWFM